MRVMVPQRSGKIVNMCSQAGKHGFPTHVAYTTAKFAVTGMTQSIANWAAPYNIMNKGGLKILTQSICAEFADKNIQ